MFQKALNILKTAKDILDNWERLKTEVNSHTKELDLVLAPAAIGNFKQYKVDEKGDYQEINNGRTIAEERVLIRAGVQ